MTAFSIKPAPATEPRGSLGRGPDEAGDEALVAAAARRDPEALGQLFDRHHQALARFLTRLLARAGAASDVDDLVHATFLEAFRCAAKFRAQGSVRTWLFGIAINVSRHHARGESRRRALHRQIDVPVAPEAMRPDHSIEQRQLLEKLGAAVAALSHERRAAFFLCEVEGFTGMEAAAALGVPAGTVGRWLFEARGFVKRALGEGSA